MMAQAHLSSLDSNSADREEPSAGEDEEQHEKEEETQAASATCGGRFNTTPPSIN